MSEKKIIPGENQLSEKDLEKVTGGIRPGSDPISGFLVGTTTCKRCGEPFTYEYYYNMVLDGHKDGGAYKPELCPNCEDPAENVGR